MLVVTTFVAAVLVMFGLVALTKWSILRRYKGRADFGGEATITLSEDGIVGIGRYVEGKWQWGAYPRAVRFSDGILLLRTGVVRWLPDAAIQVGTVEDVTKLVGTKSALRIIA